MNKIAKYELETIISKTKSIILDTTMFSIMDIESIAKIADDENCTLTLQNANHLSKLQIEKILKINPNVTLQFTNPSNMVTVENITDLLNKIEKLQKQLTTLEKKLK